MMSMSSLLRGTRPADHSAGASVCNDDVVGIAAQLKIKISCHSWSLSGTPGKTKRYYCFVVSSKTVKS